jgi:putative ABC transport system permease protein
MLQNLFKTAWRNVSRHKSYTFINIIGLGSGIAICLVIFVLIQFHTSFDNFHSKEGQNLPHAYRVPPCRFKGYILRKGVSWAVPQFLKSDVPAVEEVAPVFIIARKSKCRY